MFLLAKHTSFVFFKFLYYGETTQQKIEESTMEQEIEEEDGEKKI